MMKYTWPTLILQKQTGFAGLTRETRRNIRTPV
jgi:hypothetical protein